MDPLDRPIWSALTSRQSHFAQGRGRALRFDPEVEPFAAAIDDSAESLRDLAAVIPEGGTVLLLQRGESPVPPGTTVEIQAPGVQMIFDGERLGDQAADEFPIAPLGVADAGAMRALAELTEPGPWRSRTHEIGHFEGIRIDGQLAAMAGERMKLPGLTEISGVATHPGFRGRGFAAALMRRIAARIIARGERPFLHAYAGNHAAIALYERLGFRIRCEVAVTILSRRPG